MSRIAVIGATSFSGKSFVKEAQKTHEVKGFSRSDGYNLRGAHDSVVGFNPEIVVNFAALNMVNESWENYEDYYLTNVIGVANLAKSLKGIRRFVQVSTPEVYGNVGRWLKEGSPFNPSTPYAVSRAAADMHLLSMFKANGFPVCFTRTVNVYGEGQQPYRIIPKSVLSILKGKKIPLHGGGLSMRSFIHIDDVSDGIMRVATEGIDGESYHMATDQMWSISSVVRMVCEIMGVSYEDCVEETPDRTGKDPAYLLDYSKMRDFGWSYKKTLEDALPKVVEWFKGNSSLYDSLEYRHAA